MITKHPNAGGRIIGGGTGQFFEISVKSAVFFDQMTGVSRVHEKNINDAVVGLDQQGDFGAVLAKIRNLPLGERPWAVVESRPNLQDRSLPVEVKVRFSSGRGENFEVNKKGKDRTQECVALVAFYVPLEVKPSLPVVGYAIAMPALRYAADIGLLRAVSLMKGFDRTGFVLLQRKPQKPGKESPDYVSVKVVGSNKWELWSKRDRGHGYFKYEKLNFDPAFQWLSIGHLQKIHDYKHVLPNGCIEIFNNIDETAAVVNRIFNASNAAVDKVTGWRQLDTSSLLVECRVEVKPFKFVPTRRPWLDARRRHIYEAPSPRTARETGVRRPALGPPHTAREVVHASTVDRYETVADADPTLHDVSIPAAGRERFGAPN